MKKQYGFLLMGSILLMVLSLVFCAFEVIESSGMGLEFSFLNNLYGTVLPLPKINQEETYNYLSEVSRQPSGGLSMCFTNSGYEGLSTDAERMCYGKIKASCSNISSEGCNSGYCFIEPITIPNTRLSAPQIKKVLYAIQNDNPQIFWIASSFNYMYHAGNTVIKLNSLFSNGAKEKACETLENKVSQIMAKLPANASEYDKELFIHDYLINNCKYEKDSAQIQRNPKIFTAYGCLIDGAAVCEGYSKATQLLLSRAGVSARTVTGSRGAEPHMWNIVKIDGNWYHLDVTWDGGGELGRYNYFNVSDEVIKFDHEINAPIDKTADMPEDKRYNFYLPMCNSIKDNYFEKNAVKISKLDDASMALISGRIVRCGVLGDTYVYVKPDKSLSLDLVKNGLFSVYPYKFFACIEAANKNLSAKGIKIDPGKVQYAQCRAQNVITVQLNYV